jgi:hypothetical protein
MKKIYIICGGTMQHVSPHFSLTAPAYGKVGTQIEYYLNQKIQTNSRGGEYSVILVPTKMATGCLSDDKFLFTYKPLLKKAGIKDLETNDDLKTLVDALIEYPDTRCIIMAAAVCDFKPVSMFSVHDADSDGVVLKFGKDQQRLDSNKIYSLDLAPSDKILPNIRQKRKDIFVVSFKTTSGVGRDETYKRGLLSLKKNSSNLVFANDTKDKINMVITPEEFPYESDTREEALTTLVDITFKRLNLTFGDKTIVRDDKRAFPEELIKEGAIPQNWYDVMKYLFDNKAFKPLPGTGKTSGHFGCRVFKKEYEIITSERKINHNESFQRGMIPVYSYKNGELIVGGAKPSVGEKTQELIYQELGDKIHSIVHFHCPMHNGLEEQGVIPVREQLHVECGSRECAINTFEGIKYGEIIPGVYAVHLKNHGPNIAFHKDVPAEKLIEFINKYWDLEDKTGGIIKNTN